MSSANDHNSISSIRGDQNDDSSFSLSPLRGQLLESSENMGDNDNDSKGNSDNLSTIIHAPRSIPHHVNHRSGTPPLVSPLHQYYYHQQQQAQHQQHQPRSRLNSENSIVSSNGSVIIHGRQLSHGEAAFYDSDCGDASDGSVIFQSNHELTPMLLQHQHQQQQQQLNVINNVPLSSLPYPQRRLYWSNRDTGEGSNAGTIAAGEKVSPTKNTRVMPRPATSTRVELPPSRKIRNTMRTGASPVTGSMPSIHLPRSRNNSLDQTPTSSTYAGSNITPPRHRNYYYQGSSIDECASPIYSSQPYHTTPRSTSSRDSQQHQHSHESKKSGNSAFLGSLSNQLAKDVAHFFHREKGASTSSNNSRSNNTSDHHSRTSSGEGLLSHDFLPSSAHFRQSSSSSHILNKNPRFGVGHNRLPSIEHDDWTNEYTSHHEQKDKRASTRDTIKINNCVNSKQNNLPTFPDLGGGDEVDLVNQYGSGLLYSSDELRYSMEADNTYSNERTSLLPPTGISSQEQSKKTKKKKNNKSPKKKNRQYPRYLSSSSEEEENPYYSKEEFENKLNEEKHKFIMQWKAQMQESQREQRVEESWFNQIKRLWIHYHNLYRGVLSENIPKFKDKAESYLNNLPLTTGAIAYSFASLGTIWFKFTEEMLTSCVPVHYHSQQCSFPEYPGCFQCDPTVIWYRLALFGHYTLLSISALMAMNVISKCIVAPRIVADEMSSPITAAPAGMTCICLVVVFAGRGLIGKLIVCFASFTHFCILLWFLYMAAAYRILPDASWYPNTTAIGICAVKTWLYYPYIGHFLMAICLSLCAFFLPMSIARTFLSSENKISAPVCWMQMGAPSQALYALTLMAQPNFIEEHPDVSKFDTIHRIVYLPCMHFFFFLCVIAAASSIFELARRWKRFVKKPFSPAHAAFTCPHLTHANAIQAYRAALNGFSTLEPSHPYRRFVEIYWFTFLFLGSALSIGVATKYLYSLGRWVQPNLEDEEEPPAPNETFMSELISTTGDEMRQVLISPAVLQANETGLLVKIHDEYKRTRRIPALGFTPALNWSEMQRERELLLDHVAKNPPRQRKRTLSVPGVDFSYGFNDIDIGTGNQGVYEGGRHGRVRAGTIDVVRHY